MKFIVSIYYNNSLLLILVIISVIFFNHFISITYAQTIDNDNNAPLSGADDIFNNFKEGLLNFAKQLENTVDIDADQVFPNKTIKYNMILNRYEPSEYTIPLLTDK
jgi:hypothetical protein